MTERMTTEQPEAGTQCDPLRPVEDALEQLPEHRDSLPAAREALREIAGSAQDADRHGVERLARVLEGLLELVETQLEGSGSPLDHAGDEESAFREGAPATESTNLHQLITVIGQGIAPLRRSIIEHADASDDIERFVQSARNQWGDYLSLFESSWFEASEASDDENSLWDAALSDGPTDTWSDETDATIDNDDSPASVNREDVGRILQALDNVPLLDRPAVTTAFTTDTDSAGQAVQGRCRNHPPADTGGSPFPPETTRGDSPFEPSNGSLPDAPPAPVQLELDGDLLEAFLEDAQAGLARLEQLVLTVESDPADESARQQICRELHTLKGASASVGLSDLAAYLHAVEDYVQTTSGGEIDATPMLSSVDAMRRQIATLAGEDADSTPHESSNRASAESSAGGARSSSSATSPPVTSSGGASSGREESLRVKTSRVEKLMDLLAELVTLRNQRDSRVGRLKSLRTELARCVMRLRVFTGGNGSGLHPNGPSNPASVGRDSAPKSCSADDPSAGHPTPFGSVVEIANDVAEFARTLDDIVEPMEAENVAISQFIRQFRLELTAMRRLPVAGLFQRLHRAAQDAARVEGKRIHFHLEGEHAGLDRSLQERLYEPLLHMVRNAVSHGIESEAERRQAGKPERGTITLSAKGSPTMLVIEASDDGRGLDYEAIRRRAIENGLISVSDTLDEHRLARLIFHPGFSTRQETSEISGRGVGMDVVATTLQRLRAKIDVNSQPGTGTTMRIAIPLRSVIEHVMAVRIAGQLFALPMQFVQAAGPVADITDIAETPDAASAPGRIRLRQLLGGELQPARDGEQMLLFGSGRLAIPSLFRAGPPATETGSSAATAQNVQLLVDSVVGPEEIVVRSLPPLLKSHPLLSGISLSGAGEIVLLLDGQRLMDLALQTPSTADATTNVVREHSDDSPHATGDVPDNASRVLVVDDSLSARRHLVKLLQQAGIDTVEAADGIDGLDQFRKRTWPVVFTDIEMPRLDGLELLAELKRSGNDGTPRVVVVSSRTEGDYRQRAAALGADAYLTKPVEPSALNDVLAKLGVANE